MKRYYFFLEIALFYSFLVAFNWFFFPQIKGFLDVDPHPYWFGILLFGFRYGVVAGFSSGFLSCFLYLGLAWLAGERYRFEELAFYALPSFFIFVGVFVGVITARHRGTIEMLENENTQQDKSIQAAKTEIQTLQEINRGLEKKIVTRMSTMVTLYEGAKQMEEETREKLYPAILRFTAKTVEAEEAAVYLKGEEGWDLAHSFGWKEYQRRPRRIGLNEGITGLAGNGDKVISVRDFVSDAKLKGISPELVGDALLAGPLRLGEKGAVVGVLSIQNIPFINFNSATVNLFNFLLKWASRALERAHYIEMLRGQEVIDPEYNIYSKKYLMARLEQEFFRSKTYYLPLSVGLVEISPLEMLPKGRKHIYLLTVSQLIKASCRDMDVVALFDDGSVPFAFILVTASKKETDAIKRKILENYAKLKLGEMEQKLSFNIAISSFSPQVENIQYFFTEAKQILKNGAMSETLS